jgi:hypothetical protein
MIYFLMVNGTIFNTLTRDLMQMLEKLMVGYISQQLKKLEQSLIIQFIH